MGHHQIAVFLGPSCPLDEARMHLPDADYFPPASRGSFYGIINDGYRVIALIDGLFYGKFSVWHKEILFAIDSGITVIGASSMGALRAAELEGPALSAPAPSLNGTATGVSTATTRWHCCTKAAPTVSVP